MALLKKKKKIQTFTLPFFLLFWRTGCFCLQHLWRDGGTAGKVLPRGQSGVPLMVWKEKWGRGGTVPFLPLLGAECCFWNFLSGIIRGADFFDFLWLCLLYMNCFWGDSLGCPGHHCSLSQLDLFDISRTKWRILTITCKQCISERLRVGFRGEMAVRGGLILRSFFCVFCSVLDLFFSQNAVFCCPQDVAENVFDLPEEPSHSLVFPKMPSYTPDKHTVWILPFISPSESRPHCPAVVGPTDSSSPSLMDSRLHRFNWVSKLDARLKELTGRIFWTKGCNEGNVDAESIRVISVVIVAKKITRKHPQDYSNCHQGEDRWGIILFLRVSTEKPLKTNAATGLNLPLLLQYASDINYV